VRYVLNKVYDKEAVYSVITQFLALLFPVFFIWYLSNDFGKDQVIIFEAVLSLVAFLGVIQDYGTSIFLSHKKPCKVSLAKYAGVAIVLKLFIVFISSPFLYLAFILFGGNADIYIYTFLILLVGSFDSSFVFFCAGKSHYYSFLVALRLPICFVVTYAFGGAVEAYLVGCVALSVVSFSYCLVATGYKLKYSSHLLMFLLVRYRLVTLTEAMTAIFSQLDGYLVSRVLSADQAFIYLLIRKFIRAANTLMAYVYRIAYTRKKQNQVSSSNIIKIIFIFNTLAFICINMVGEMGVSYFFGSEISSQNVVVWVIFSQSLVLLVGGLKTIVRNTYLFIHEKFMLHFVATLFSTLVFILPIICFYYLNANTDAMMISNLRVLADVIYLLVVSICIYLGSRSARKSLTSP